MEENKYLDITCKIMNAAMKGESLDLSAYDNDPEFLRIMKEQTFLPFLYEVDKRKIWRKYYYQAYLINEKFDAIGKKIKDIFDANNIDHIFLKGFELKKLYPKPWLRQIGDIDILVREEDFIKASTLLKENYFKVFSEVDHHLTITYDNLMVDLHHKIIRYKDDCSSHLNTPFLHATKFNKNTYILDAEYNFSFLINHYIKHFREGSGVRYYCDFYLFMQKNDISFKYIDKKYNKFIESILETIYFIFNFKKNKFKDKQIAKDIINYSLSSGIHGFSNNNDKPKTAFLLAKKSKFKYLCSKLFIPINEMFKFYPWTKSILLLPIGYIVRFFHLLIAKKKNLSTVLKTQKNENIFDKIGL